MGLVVLWQSVQCSGCLPLVDIVTTGSSSEDLSDEAWMLLGRCHANHPGKQKLGH